MKTWHGGFSLQSRCTSKALQTGSIYRFWLRALTSVNQKKCGRTTLNFVSMVHSSGKLAMDAGERGLIIEGGDNPTIRFLIEPGTASTEREALTLRAIDAIDDAFMKGDLKGKLNHETMVKLVQNAPNDQTSDLLHQFYRTKIASIGDKAREHLGKNPGEFTDSVALLTRFEDGNLLLNSPDTTDDLLLRSTNTASGDKTATFPDNTGTVAELNLIQTWTADQISDGLSDLGTTANPWNNIVSDNTLFCSNLKVFNVDSDINVFNDLDMQAGDTVDFNDNSTSAAAGVNGDVPSQVVGYIQIKVQGTVRKVPFYAA
ncbi:hypothetical protein LCGC14_2198440 [marine sediment metagenome]|uniref:Uncharacterized protein n=1 Tax=marine sediment metagenome TaxID=412755 RepID=A0A0F9DHE9_9ZZZZ